MRNLLLAAAAAVTCLACSIPTSAETLTVESADPFNFVEALADPKAGGSIQLEVDLTFPDGAKGTTPAVVFVHGAGGPQPHHETWLRFFRELGLATAYADHFKPRGKGSAVGSHIRLTGAAMAVDALHILNTLAAHPRVDPERIIIMGGSKGGGVALYTSWRPLQQAISPAETYAAHIPLYPTCMHWDQPETTGKPILVLLAENDDWTGVEQCLESVEAFREAGYSNVKARVYAGALHGFDSMVPRTKVPRAFSVVNCRFSIDPDGKDYANGKFMGTPESKRASLGACISRGATYGMNVAALDAAQMDVRRFLEATISR